MNLPPDQPPPSAPAKPKIASEERRARQTDRLMTIRLRMAIGRKLEDRGITTPAAIDQAVGMPAVEAVKLLTRRQWREAMWHCSKPLRRGWGCDCRPRLGLA